MPQLPFSTAFTANQLGVNPLSGWQYEWIPWFGMVQLFMRSTDTNLRATVYSGSETIQERAPIQGGGTAGTTPNIFTTPPVEWVAAANDRLKLTIDNVGAGTPTLDGLIIANPA